MIDFLIVSMEFSTNQANRKESRKDHLHGPVMYIELLVKLDENCSQEALSEEEEKDVIEEVTKCQKGKSWWFLSEYTAIIVTGVIGGIALLVCVW